MASTSPTLISLLDFIAEEEDVEPFLVEPFFPAGGICYFHGKGGLGKSFVANAMLKSVADGTPFLGRFRATQGRVVYVQADMTPATQRGRLRKAIKVIAHPENVRVLQWHGSFDIEREVKAKAAWIAALGAEEAALVIVDTVRKTHRNEESNNDWPAQYYGLWKEIVGEASLFFISHDNKDGLQDTRADDDRARGAHAWIDDADAALRLVQRKGQLILRWSKVRTCEPLEALRLCIDDDTQMAAADIESELLQNALAQYPSASNHEIAKMLAPHVEVGERTLMRRLAKIRPQGVKGVSQEGGMTRVLSYPKAP